MRFKDQLRDSIGIGVIMGMMLIPIFYFVAEGIRKLIVNYKGDEYILRPPATQLLALLFSLIVFRIIMINWNKENTGKGFLLVVMFAVISYFFFYFKLRSQ